MKNVMKHKSQSVWKSLGIGILLLLGTSIVHAQELIQKSASVDFKIKNMGFNVDGNFSDVSVVTNFKSNNLTHSYINGTIKVSSIDTDNAKRDKHLRTKDYFEVDTYKTIQFTSTKIVKKSSNNYQVTAQLTIKKTTKTIVIPLVVNETGNSVTMKGNFSIDRLNYDVGESSWVLSDIVKIQVNYTGKR